MSNPNPSGRLHCPNCNARVAIPAGNRSPYIRCGVCDALFETEVEPVEITPNVPVKPTEDDGVFVVSGPVETTSNHSHRQQNRRPTPEFDWTRPERQAMGMRWTTGSVAIVAILIFGVLIFSLLSWADSTHPRSRSRGYSYRSSTGYPVKSSRATSSVIEAMKDWNSPTNEYPRFEIDLNGENPASLNINVDSIKLNGRNFTLNEINELLGLYKLRKLTYTNVKIQLSDIKLLNCRRFFELDLSHCQWSPGQIHFDRKSFPYLNKLNLSYSNVQEFSLVDIDECDRLTHLNLRGTELDDDGLLQLKYHPSIVELDVCETKVTFDSLQKLKMAKLKLLKVTAGVLTTSQREKIMKNNPLARVLVINEP